MSFIEFGKFLTTLSSHNLSAPSSLSSSSGTPTEPVGVPLMVSPHPLGSVHYPSIFFLSVPQILSFQLSYFQVLWFFLLSTQVCFESLLWTFHFNYCCYFRSRISFWFLLMFSISWYFYFVQTLLSWLSAQFPVAVWASVRQVWEGLCLVRLPSGRSWGQFLLVFLPLDGSYFLGLPRDFSCWKLDTGI